LTLNKIDLLAIPQTHVRAHIACTACILLSAEARLCPTCGESTDILQTPPQSARNHSRATISHNISIHTPYI